MTTLSMEKDVHKEVKQEQQTTVEETEATRDEQTERTLKTEAENEGQRESEQAEHEVNEEEDAASNLAHLEAEEQSQQAGAEEQKRDAEGETEAFSVEQWQKEVEQWQQKWEEAKQQAEEHYQKYLRAQADFENFRRRTRKEKEDQAQYAAQSLVEKMLPVLDNFERALAAGKEAQQSESLIQGIEMVFKQLQQALEAEGVEVIPAVGEPFDPHVHEAVGQVESEEYEPGIVVEQLQKGYKLKDRVMRPAMVKVSS